MPMLSIESSSINKFISNMYVCYIRGFIVSRVYACTQTVDCTSVSHRKKLQQGARGSRRFTVICFTVYSCSL